MDTTVTGSPWIYSALCFFRRSIFICFCLSQIFGTVIYFKGFILIYKNIYVIITILLFYYNLLSIYCPENTIQSCTIKYFSVFMFAETIENLKDSRWRLTAGTIQSAENKSRTEANSTTEQYALQFVRWTVNRHLTWRGKKKKR